MCETLDHQIAIEDNVVRLWTTKYIRFPRINCLECTVTTIRLVPETDRFGNVK